MLFKLLYTTHQFTNIMLSCMLIVTGILLFRATKRTHNNIFKNVNVLIFVYTLISILILVIYDLKALKPEDMTYMMLYELLISLFLITNIYFQIGIYNIFSNNEYTLCILNQGTIISSFGELSTNPDRNIIYRIFGRILKSKEKKEKDEKV